VANHGHRLALDLGVALRHMDRNFFVRAGDNFRLGVAAVVDHCLVETAEARGTVHGEVVNVEGLEHVDHEVAATRALVDRVWCRRHGFGGGKLRSGRLGLRPLSGAARDRGGCRPRCERCCARKRRAFQKIATNWIGRRIASWHDFLPGNDAAAF